MNHNQKFQWLIITGLAFVFLFVGIDKFVHPDYWQGWIPQFFDGFMNINLAVWNWLFGGTEIIFGLLLFSKRTRFWGALGITLELLFIVIVLTRLSPTGVRDIGLLFMAIFLLATSRTKGRSD